MLNQKAFFKSGNPRSWKTGKVMEFEGLKRKLFNPVVAKAMLIVKLKLN